MNRRSTSTRGYVKFPIEDPCWKNSQEGGMFVQLVVVDPNENVGGNTSKDWMECCGGLFHLTASETFIGDDYHLNDTPGLPEGWGKSESPAELEKAAADYSAPPESEKFHFPNIDMEMGDNTPKDLFTKYTSTAYLAVITMGSTGWSGWSDEKDRMWNCTYDDLTREGKLLYQIIEDLYIHCQLYLVTWLDT